MSWIGTVAALAFLPLAAAEAPKLTATQALAAYRMERTAATGDGLAAADKLAARAQAALDAGDWTSAHLLTREARWALPAPAAARLPQVERLLGGSRLRHADRVNALAFTPDGAFLVTASRDGTAQVWNLGNGRQVQVYRGHAPPSAGPEQGDVFRVAAVAIHPNGELVATSGGGEIHLWDRVTARRVRTIPAPMNVRGLAFSPDGQTVIGGGDDKRVTVWATADGTRLGQSAEQPSRIEALALETAGKFVATVNLGGELFIYPLERLPKPQVVGVGVTAGGAAALSVAFLPGGAVATAGADGSLRLTALPGTATTRSHPGHPGRPQVLAVMPGGKRLLTGALDGQVRAWDAATWELHARYPVCPPTEPGDSVDGGVTALAVSPDGLYAAAGSHDGTVKIIPLAEVDLARATPGATGELWGLALSPDGTRTATAGTDGQIRVYLTDTGELERTLTGHTGSISTLTFASNDILLSGGGADGTVRRWNLKDGTGTKLGQLRSAVLALVADKAGDQIFSGDALGTLAAMSATGQEAWKITGSTAITTLGVGPDSRYLVVGTADGTLQVRSPRNGKLLSQMPAHLNGTAALAVFPEGVRLATVGGDGALRVWQVTAAGQLTPGRRLEPLPRTPDGGNRKVNPALAAVAVSPDGLQVAAAGADGVVRVHEVQTLVERRSFRGATDWVTGLAFTPDGQALLAAAADKTWRRYDLPKSAPDASHTGAVTAAALSPDGKQIATVSSDRLVKLWDRATGRLTATLSGSPAGLSAVAFAGPSLLVTGGEDSQLRWWDIQTRRQIRTRPVNGRVFALAADPATGRVALAWARLADRSAGLDVFVGDGTPSGTVSEPGPILCGTVSGNTRIGALATAEGVKVYDLLSASKLGLDWPLFVATTADISLSADGQTLVGLGPNGEVKVAQVAQRASGEPLKVPAADAVLLAPAGDRFLTYTTAGEVQLWTTKGTRLRTWTLPNLVTSVNWASDGNAALATHGDGTTSLLELP